MIDAETRIEIAVVNKRHLYYLVSCSYRLHKLQDCMVLSGSFSDNFEHHRGKMQLILPIKIKQAIKTTLHMRQNHCKDAQDQIYY